VAAANKISTEKGYLWVQTKGRCAVRGVVDAGEMATVVSSGGHSTVAPVAAATDIPVGRGVKAGTQASMVDVDFN
jgi:hypothetical protein